MSQSSNQLSRGGAAMPQSKSQRTRSRMWTASHRGVENHSTARAADAWRIDAAGSDERLMRPGHESLIRDRLPDAVVSDVQFIWNAEVAAGLGVPGIMFHAIGAFAMLAIFNLLGAPAAEAAAAGVVALPGLPGPDIRVPVTELPEIVRNQRQDDGLATGAPVSYRVGSDSS